MANHLKPGRGGNLLSLGDVERLERDRYGITQPGRTKLAEKMTALSDFNALSASLGIDWKD